MTWRCNTFPLPGELVAAAADEEVHLALGEDGLALHQLPRVALVEEVVDAVGVDADLPAGPALARHLHRDLLVGARVPLPLRLRLGVERRGPDEGARARFHRGGHGGGRPATGGLLQLPPSDRRRFRHYV